VIIVDTNVLVALTDRDDQHHARCRQWLQTTESPLLVPSTVLAEACYLIDR
jgi:predicted nucleic acid-binding protein